MPALAHHSHHRTWILLVAATLVGYTLRAEGFVGSGVGLATLAVAYLKGRLVILDFMELRTAPRLWRALVEGWLLAVSGLVFAIYVAAAVGP